MTAANYSTLSACNFALVAVLQLMPCRRRLTRHDCLHFNSNMGSWFACVVAAILVWLGVTVSQT